MPYSFSESVKTVEKNAKKLCHICFSILYQGLDIMVEPEQLQNTSSYGQTIFIEE